MPVTSSPAFTSAAAGACAPCAPPAALHSGHRRSAAQGRVPWLRLALLAIAVQLVVMAQLAQYQVQRGVQLRQAQAVGMAGAVANAHAVQGSVRTASTGQNHADARTASIQVLR